MSVLYPHSGRAIASCSFSSWLRRDVMQALLHAAQDALQRLIARVGPGRPLPAGIDAATRDALASAMAQALSLVGGGCP